MCTLRTTPAVAAAIASSSSSRPGSRRPADTSARPSRLIAKTSRSSSRVSRAISIALRACATCSVDLRSRAGRARPRPTRARRHRRRRPAPARRGRAIPWLLRDARRWRAGGRPRPRPGRRRGPDPRAGTSRTPVPGTRSPRRRHRGTTAPARVPPRPRPTRLAPGRPRTHGAPRPTRPPPAPACPPGCRHPRAAGPSGEYGPESARWRPTGRWRQAVACPICQGLVLLRWFRPARHDLASSVVGLAQPARETPCSRSSSWLRLQHQRDVDQLVLLAADQVPPAGLEQDLGAGDAVPLGGVAGVLEERAVDAGVAHHQRHPVQLALLGHGRADHVLGRVDDLQEVDAGAPAELVAHPDERLQRRVAGPGAEAADRPVDLGGAGPGRDDGVGDAEPEVLVAVEADRRPRRRSRRRAPRPGRRSAP